MSTTNWQAGVPSRFGPTTLRRYRFALRSTCRRVVVGPSAAGGAVAAGLPADRLSSSGARTGGTTDAAAIAIVPSDGSWQPVAVSADVADTAMHPFEHGAFIGFVRRVDGRVEAVSGICTHQACRLWFDQADDRLR